MVKMSVNEAFSTDVDKIRAALGNNAEARQLLWNLHEGAKGLDAFRLALQNLCTAASDVLTDVPGARHEVQVRLDEADRVLRGV